MLLYLTTTPEDDGGTTDFLETVEDEDSVVFSVRPKRGAMVVFPHDAAHVGRCVGTGGENSASRRLSKDDGGNDVATRAARGGRRGWCNSRA